MNYAVQKNIIEITFLPLLLFSIFYKKKSCTLFYL